MNINAEMAIKLTVSRPGWRVVVCLFRTVGIFDEMRLIVLLKEPNGHQRY